MREITITRTKDDVTATATRVVGGWDFVATTPMGKYVAADFLRSYNSVLRAFAILGL